MSVATPMLMLTPLAHGGHDRRAPQPSASPHCTMMAWVFGAAKRANPRTSRQSMMMMYQKG